MRRIEAIPLKIPAAPIEGGFDDEGTPEPVVEWGDPADLWVDDAYQRPIGDKGLGLIRRVAGGKWNWRKFQMPTVTIGVDGRRLLIDGQHTATMALTRGIRRIPWLLVETVGQADQADSFVAQNMDRTAITTMNEHRARVAAGDPGAVEVERLCKASGVTLCLVQKTGKWAAGDTMALSAIRTMVVKRGSGPARKVLETCVAANLAPISRDHIRAVDALLNEDEFAGLVAPEKISSLLQGKVGAKIDADAGVFAGTHRVPKWKGLTSELFKASRRRAAA